MRVEYLFSPQTLPMPGFDMRNVVDFTNLVMTEDAEVCELNQRGLHAAAARARRGHARGIRHPAVPRMGECRTGACYRRTAALRCRARSMTCGCGGARHAAQRGRRVSSRCSTSTTGPTTSAIAPSPSSSSATHIKVVYRCTTRTRRWRRSSGRAFRLRHRQHHHRILRPADPGGRLPAARQEQAPNLEEHRSRGARDAGAGGSRQSLCGAVPACHERLCLQRRYDQGAHARRADRQPGDDVRSRRWCRSSPTAA